MEFLGKEGRKRMCIFLVCEKIWCLRLWIFVLNLYVFYIQYPVDQNGILCELFSKKRGKNRMKVSIEAFISGYPDF